MYQLKFMKSCEDGLSDEYHAVSSEAYRAVIRQNGAHDIVYVNASSEQITVEVTNKPGENRYPVCFIENARGKTVDCIRAHDKPFIDDETSAEMVEYRADSTSVDIPVENVDNLHSGEVKAQPMNRPLTSG